MAEHAREGSRHHYLKDLKQCVVYQQFTLGMETVEIARSLDMSVRVVQRVLRLWEEIGEVVKDPRQYAKKGWARLLDTASVEVRSGAHVYGAVFDIMISSLSWHSSIVTPTCILMSLQNG